MKSEDLISVVIPVYGCKTTLYELYQLIVNELSVITQKFEIILVNDASPDNAWEIIEMICEKDNRVQGINLSRNFGQHYALTAGLDYTNGNWVVVMDCDLQDKPSEIQKLYFKALEGYDIVLGRRIKRKDRVFKKIWNKIFYKIFYLLTDVKLDNKIGTFRIMSDNVVENYRKLKEQSRFFGGLINWLGFETITIDIEHNTRKEGKSAYTFKALLKMAADNIFSFSDKLLKLTVKFGFIMLILSAIFISYKVISSLLSDTQIVGWSSLIATVLFSTGLIITVLGIVGIYVGKIFEESKSRPLYIISKHLNKKNDV